MNAMRIMIEASDVAAATDEFIIIAQNIVQCSFLNRLGYVLLAQSNSSLRSRDY